MFIATVAKHFNSFYSVYYNCFGLVDAHPFSPMDTWFEEKSIHFIVNNLIALPIIIMLRNTIITILCIHIVRKLLNIKIELLKFDT